MAQTNSPITYNVLKTYNSTLRTYDENKFVKLVEGKDLSSNDFTNTYKDKLDIDITTNDSEDSNIDFEKEWS